MNQVRKFSPFNVYDFYGYLFPGAILSLFTLFIVIWFTPLSFRSILEVLEEVERLRIILGIVVGSGFVAMVYFVGHVNGTLSHLFFDRTLLKKVVGYPVYSLLNLTDEMCFFSRAFNFYILFFLNLIILLPLIKIVFPHFVGFRYLYIMILVLIVITIVFRVTIGLFYSNVSEGHCDYIALNKKSAEGARWGHVLDFGCWLFCLGLSLFYRIVLPVIRLILSNDGISSDVIKNFKSNIKKLTGHSSDKIGSDNFWLPYIYIHRNEPELEEQLSNWMNLYAFLKNLSFVAFILCFELSLAVTLHFMKIGTVYHVTDPFDIKVIIGGFGFLYVSGWILALRYWIIYRNYFTKYLIRSFSSLELPGSENEKSEVVNTALSPKELISSEIITSPLKVETRRRRRSSLS